MAESKVKFLLLIILDGWGVAPPSGTNAITAAKTPNFNRLWNSYSHTILDASGKAVGLPEDEDGNSEVGHLNIGAGFIVLQDLTKINASINDDSFYSNPAFQQAVNHAKTNHSTLHLMGLVGGGGVHASNDHLFALIKMAKISGVEDLIIHVFTDGRDSSPTSSLTYLNQLIQKTDEQKIGRIGTVMGRYWAMDRDNRWQRTQKAYNALTLGQGETSRSAQEAIKQSYGIGITDEFIKPTVIVGEDGKPSGLIKDNDAVIFYNFRIDRPRQLTKSFVLKNFGNDYFPRPNFVNNLFFVTMTNYDKEIPVSAVAYNNQEIILPLSRVISEKELRQFHLAESEKERFISYYFDGFRDQPFPGENWVTIPSPKVATYDLAPQMSAIPLTDRIIDEIKQANYSFLIVNFANADMVGHTGKLDATVRAIETVDECLGRIIPAVLSFNGSCIITGDHGNAEELADIEAHQIDTKHSTNPVPFIYISNETAYGRTLEKGILADVAPTILSVLDILKPAVMTGKNLLGDYK